MLPDIATVFALLAPNKDAILSQAVAQAKVATGGAQPQVDGIKQAAFLAARKSVVDMLLPECATLLTGAASVFPFTVGPRPEGVDINDPAYIEWREQFDEHMMDALGPDLLRSVGQDFVGNYFTDSELDDPGMRETAAKDMAESLTQTAVKNRQPGQVLAEIGITHGDLLQFAVAPAAGAAPVAEEVAVDPTDAINHVNKIVGEYAIKLGVAGFDMTRVQEMLAGAFDDDPFLPLSFIEQLGGTQADAPFFAAVFAAQGKACVETTAQAAFMAAVTGAIGVAAAPVAGPEKPKRTSKKTSAVVAPSAVAPPPPLAPAVGAAATATGDDADYSDVIKLIRDNLKISDETLGALVGKSRAHMSNVGKGKSPMPLEPHLKKALLSDLQTRATALEAAIARLI